MAPSRFAANPRGILSRLRRRVKRTNTALRAAWATEGERVDKAEGALRAAGFFDPDHYDAGPNYCKCGTVKQHNENFDRIVGR